jgi:transglutaminase-like putative cysteine protease
VIYDVTHLTRYRYGAPVAVNACVLRLLPRSEKGQRVVSAHIEVTPRPQTLVERADSFANRVVRMRIETPHRELAIESRARVVVERPAPPLAALTPPWEDVAALAAATDSLGADSPALAIYPSRLVPLFEPATSYARASFPPRRPVYEAARELSLRIKADFVYDAEATEVTTSPTEAFARRRGVCQDFTHVMIAGLRGLGLPALYVSGYIRTIPAPSQARLAGADASHAWVALWCGPGFGWLGLDPTNALAAGDDHIVVARGRDYSDAPPVEGVILSSGGHELEVEVDVTPV